MPDARERPIIQIDPDDYTPLYDTDFIDDDLIHDDQDLADVIGDERMRRRDPRVHDEGDDE